MILTGSYFGKLAKTPEQELSASRELIYSVSDHEML